MTATDSGTGVDPALDSSDGEASGMVGRRALRALGWVVGSLFASTLAIAAFAFALYAYSVRADLLGDANIRQAQIIVGVYFWVVTLKGLLPMQLVVLVLWPAWRVVAPDFTARRAGAIGALIASSVFAYAWVVPLLLTRKIGELPGLQITTVGQHAGSIASMTLVIVLSTWLFGRLFRFLPPKSRRA